MRKIFGSFLLLFMLAANSFAAWELYIIPGLTMSNFNDGGRFSQNGPSLLLNIETMVLPNEYLGIGVGLGQTFLNEGDSYFGRRRDANHSNFTRAYCAFKNGFEVADNNKLFFVGKIGGSFFAPDKDYVFKHIADSKSGLFCALGLQYDFNDAFNIELTYSQDRFSAQSVNSVNANMVYKINL